MANGGVGPEDALSRDSFPSLPHLKAQYTPKDYHHRQPQSANQYLPALSKSKRERLTVLNLLRMGVQRDPPGRHMFQQAHNKPRNLLAGRSMYMRGEQPRNIILEPPQQDSRDSVLECDFLLVFRGFGGFEGSGQFGSVVFGAVDALLVGAFLARGGRGRGGRGLHRGGRRREVKR